MNNKRMFLCIVCITVSICQAAFSEADSTDFATRLNSYTHKNRKILDIYWTEKCDEYSAADYQHAFESHIAEHGLLYQTKKAMKRGMFEASNTNTRPMIQEAISNVLIDYVEEEITVDSFISSFRFDTTYRKEINDNFNFAFEVFTSSNYIAEDELVHTYIDVFLQLVKSNYEVLSREHYLDPNVDPFLGYVRKVIHKQIIFIALERGFLTRERRAELCELLGLPERYKKLYIDHTVWVFDNNFFNELSVGGFYNFFSALPKAAFSTKSISMRWGYYNNQVQSHWQSGGKGYGYNTFPTQLGKMMSKGQFPTDWPKFASDHGGSTMNHEVTHSFEGNIINKNPRLLARFKQLHNDASETDSLDYLRSQVSPSFFKSQKGEFLATIGNVWFANTAHTLNLALYRFDIGYKGPLHQFLWFADILSGDSDSTLFYLNTHTKINNECVSVNYERECPKLTRDSQERITSLLYQDTLYTFELNDSGNVISYTKESMQTSVMNNKKTDKRPIKISFDNNYLSLTVGSPGLYDLAIINAKGQLVKKIDRVSIRNSKLISLHSLLLSTGVYYISVLQEGNGSVIPFIKR